MDTDGAPIAARLRQEVDDVIARLLPPGSRVALIGFPNHSNVGDSALWLGTRDVFARLGIEVAYVCDWSSYSEAELRRSLGDGDTLLLNGGGNFGDLWPGQQQLREATLARFPRVRTIQLPQSIWFEGDESRERMRRLLEGHADVTLLVRERASEERARASFDVPVRPCPDMAFGLEDVVTDRSPSAPVVFLRRSDKESRDRSAVTLPAGSLELDWIAEDGAELPNDGAEGSDQRFLALARHRLARGCRLLSSGRVVITDRLHAHVLALMLGIPHIALDNSYGKVHSTVETWTGVSPLVHRADSASQAAALAERLAPVPSEG